LAGHQRASRSLHASHHIMGCASSAEYEQNNFFDHYRLGDKLGQGAFAQVRLAGSRHTEDCHAVKIIDVRPEEHRNISSSPGGVIDPRRITDARREARTMRRLGKHDHCVQLHEVFIDEINGLFYIVMERCQASLMDMLSELVHASEADISRIFREMLLGIQHVHSLNLVHRDVKPSNFLTGADGKTVKLTDYGLTKALPTQGVLKGRCGTTPFMSPEMVSHMPYSQKTDVWSLGVTAYLLLYADFPYMPPDSTSENEMQSAMVDAIRAGSPPPTFRPSPDVQCHTPSQCASGFVRALLERDPDLRCTVSSVLRMPLVCQTGGLLAPPCDVGFSLVPAIQEVRHQTRKFEAPVSPVVPTSLDDLLRRLQNIGSRAFTATQPQSTCSEELEVEAPLHGHSKPRSITHNGAFTSSQSSLSTCSSATDLQVTSFPAIRQSSAAM